MREKRDMKASGGARGRGWGGACPPTGATDRDAVRLGLNLFTRRAADRRGGRRGSLQIESSSQECVRGLSERKQFVSEAKEEITIWRGTISKKKD